VSDSFLPDEVASSKQAQSRYVQARKAISRNVKRPCMMLSWMSNFQSHRVWRVKERIPGDQLDRMRRLDEKGRRKEKRWMSLAHDISRHPQAGAAKWAKSKQDLSRMGEEN
jgi:hypothetical protein